MSLNVELVGTRYGPRNYQVTADAIADYARATNDLNERYLGPDDVVASPIFPIVPAFPFLTAVSQDPAFNADVARLMHLEHEHVLYASIRPGDVLTVSCVIDAIRPFGTGETFVLEITESREGGELVAAVSATLLIRGRGRTRQPPSVQPDKPTGAVVLEETTPTTEDQASRYAEASGDRNPIHLDDRAARMAGLPGVISHGMCTLAIATKTAVDGLAQGDPLRVRRVSGRLSRVAFPGQSLTTRFWHRDRSMDAERYAFETYDPRGRAVLNNGEVDIGPPVGPED